MPTYLLRPTSAPLSANASSMNQTPATALTNIGDNNDATRITRTEFTMSWILGYTNPSIPSTEFIAQVSGTIRYLGGNSNFFMWNYPYRNGDSVPSLLPSIFTGAAALTSVEIGRRIIDWSRASTINLRSRFSDSSTTGWQTIQYPDVWMTIYTIANSTATASNTTMVVTNVPTIPVAVASTIGWEATLSTSSPLRKVTAQIRIEANSSTGAGTTPALLETTADIIPIATGTDNISVTMPGTLANGTYKVYTRARRYSEAATPANETEMFSAWLAAATLTMSVTAMGTPTLSANADDTLDRATLIATVPTTSPYTSATVTVQRSIDAGTTWETVRGIDGIAIAFATPTTFYDYEAPAGISVRYRAQAVGRFVNDFVTSPWSTTSTITPAALTEWNLKVPETPSLNIIGVNIVGAPEETLGEEVGVFRPIDRRYPVTVAGELTGWDGTISISTVTAAAWTALAAVLESQKVLLLQSPFGWQKYIRVVGGVKVATRGTPTVPQRRATLTYVETEAP